jgi:cephalosporin-C deacetylase
MKDLVKHIACKTKHSMFACALVLVSLVATAQPVESLIKIVVTPDHANWEYALGEKAGFSIQVLKNNVPLKGARLAYQVGPERMRPMKTDTVLVSSEPLKVEGSMKEPGFLRCIASVDYEGKQYKGLATAGYAVNKIQPTVTRPADFNAFWEKGKNELKQVPLDLKMTVWPEKSSALSNVYLVNVQGYGNSRLYGVLAIPKKEGKYPAVLQVPGAGIRPYFPDLEVADQGVIVFTIGIHGIPVNLDPVVYDNLNNGALKGYFFFNPDNKDRFYYKRVYLNCVRANDVIESLPQFDGKHLAVSGNSQGGALSIVTAALDNRVQYLAAIHPALCDLTGYFNGRAGGWPHIFAESNNWYSNTSQVRETIPYYDVVNFAKDVKAEGYYTWGFNDETCPPTSMYAAYNVVNANKQLILFPDTGHWFYPEQKSKFNNWVVTKLKQ